MVRIDRLNEFLSNKYAQIIFEFDRGGKYIQIEYF